MLKRILCLLHLPPPQYGVTILNKSIVSGRLKECFYLDVVSINTAGDLKIGRGKFFYLHYLTCEVKR